MKWHNGKTDDSNFWQSEANKGEKRGEFDIVYIFC